MLLSETEVNFSSNLSVNFCFLALTVLVISSSIVSEVQRINREELQKAGELKSSVPVRSWCGATFLPKFLYQFFCCITLSRSMISIFVLFLGTPQEHAL
jgi:hypothetical protein